MICACGKISFENVCDVVKVMKEQRTRHRKKGTKKMTKYYQCEISGMYHLSTTKSK